MTDYSNIRKWLSISVKNRYHFSNSRMHFVRETHAEYIAAFNTLSESLKAGISKEDYLSWRSTWREVYAKLTYECRLAKDLRSINIIQNVNSDVNEELAIYTIAPSNQEFCLRFKILANRMLDLRQLSKEYSEAARVSEKEAA